MEDMQEKLNSILGNPEMMQKIMSMAQAFGQNTDQGKQEPPASPPPPQSSIASGLGNIDPAMIQRIAGFAQQSGIDRNQQSLLKALGPYLSRERIIKLEKAMRAAKVAGFASTALTGAGSLFSSGR